MQPNCDKWLPLQVFYDSSHAVDGKRVDSVYWSAFFAKPDYPMEIGRKFGGGIAKIQMWRGVLSDDEIAKSSRVDRDPMSLS